MTFIYSQYWLPTVVLLGSVLWPFPASADQNVVVADNGTVRCDASLKDLTRISLKDDQFASVSKVTADDPSADFQIVDEPLRGDIYISVPTGFTKPSISFFGTTHKGFTYKFLCSVSGDDAKQVFITGAQPIEPTPAGEALPASLTPSDMAGRLIAAMYSQTPVAGFDISWRPLAPVTVGSLTVQRMGQYLGASLSGDLVRLENHGTSSVVLTEDQVAPADAVAVSITNPKLAPGEATTAFVVVRTGARGEQQ